MSALARNRPTIRSSLPRSPGTIPSSMASLASGGGASVAAVPSTSASSISTTRVRYGRSSTISPRSLRPRPLVPRRRRRTSSKVAPRVAISDSPSARRRSTAGGGSQPRRLPLPRLARQEDRVGQALLDDLAVQLVVLEQLVVRAARDQPPVLEHRDLVGQRDR